jgi:polysaccharide export outer membrane protein
MEFFTKLLFFDHSKITLKLGNPLFFRLLFILSYLSFFVIFTGCAAAPGMKMSVSAPTEPKELEYAGIKVKIQPLISALQYNKPAPYQVPEELLITKPQAYILGKYDVLAVAVWDHPELSQPLGQFRTDPATGQLIDDEGIMFYPYVGDIKAEGLTIPQLRKFLTASLSGYIKEPQLDVKIIQFRSKRVYVSGAVRNAGAIPYQDIPMTLTEAIAGAGGLTTLADESKVQLIRQGKSWTIDYLALKRDARLATQILLLPDDEVRVASAVENKVYVTGAVNQPSALSMVNGELSLTRALTEAGGLDLNLADEESVYVLRWINEQIEIFHLDAKDPMALVVGDLFNLKPSDVVYVDTDGLANWNRFISLILPTAALIKSGTGTALDVKNLQN